MLKLDDPLELNSGQMNGVEFAAVNWVASC